MAAFTRDPVSVLFDRGARVLLERVYANPGTWQGTRLADPSAEHRGYFASMYGIDVDGPDNAPTVSGKRQNAYTRWGRGFTRAVYYQHRWYSGTRGGGWRDTRRTTKRNAGALELEWGRRVPARGVIPAGRAVRARLLRGGQAADRAVQQHGYTDRIFTADGQAAGRSAVAAGRDWGG